jgi:hypothetical protein
MLAVMGCVFGGDDVLQARQFLEKLPADALICAQFSQILLLVPHSFLPLPLRFSTSQPASQASPLRPPILILAHLVHLVIRNSAACCAFAGGSGNCPMVPLPAGAICSRRRHSRSNQPPPLGGGSSGGPPLLVVDRLPRIQGSGKCRASFLIHLDSSIMGQALLRIQRLPRAFEKGYIVIIGKI